MNQARNALRALVLAVAANAALAADTSYMPPPGLYQIDIAGGIKIQ